MSAALAVFGDIYKLLCSVDSMASALVGRLSAHMKMNNPRFILCGRHIGRTMHFAFLFVCLSVNLSVAYGFRLSQKQSDLFLVRRDTSPQLAITRSATAKNCHIQGTP